MSKDALGGEDSVEGLGEAAVDRGMGEGLDDLGRGEADVECGVDVDLELRLAAAERGEHAEGDELALRRGETGSGVDVAEPVGDYVLCEGWGDVGEGLDDALAAFAVDLGQDSFSALVSGLIDVGAE